MSSDEDGSPAKKVETTKKEVVEEDLLTISDELTEKYGISKDALAELIRDKQSGVEGSVLPSEHGEDIVLVNERSYRAYIGKEEE